jgi:phenylacetate-CoA ligase
MVGQLVSTVPRYLALLRSQYWSEERWRGYRKARLERVLEAAARIPFYARRFGKAASSMDFNRLPVLRRSEIAELNRSVRDSSPPRSDLIVDWSSGSTAMPAEFIYDRAHQRGRFAARARYLRSHGWSPFLRTAWLVKLNFLSGGSQDSELVRSPLFGIGNSLPNLDEFEAQFEFLRRYDPVFIYSFPSNLEGLLPLFERSGFRPPRLRGIFTGAEVLDDALRGRVESVFKVPVAENYGSTEAFLAWQCPNGGFHVNAEHVIVEVVDDHAEACRPGEMGRVLVTTLENLKMPLIRYEIGDYATAAGEDRCVCGRTLPIIGGVMGRSMNLFRARDGRLLSPWPLVEPLKARRELKQFQIVQTGADSFVVKFVAAAPLEREGRAFVEESFAKVLGIPVQVEFREVNEIARSRVGKFMIAISEMAPPS